MTTTPDSGASAATGARSATGAAAPRDGTQPLVVMGILNVTPDSFSDGGRYLDPGLAVAHGLEMIAQGAAIVDVGGESSRPGSDRPPQEEELARVIPVVRALASAGVSVSVDTMRAQVAEQSLDAGAHYINDVSGGLADPDMLRVVAARRAPFMVMHWRGHGGVMADLATYDDVVRDVRDELSARVDAALAAGIAEGDLILDPGIGFAKTAAHNWQILAHLDVFVAMGFPVLMGVSRKMFLGPMATPPGWPGAAPATTAPATPAPATPAMTGPPGAFVPEDAPPASRDVATATVTALSALAGAWGVRVHDVPSSVSAAKVVAATLAAGDAARGSAR